MPPATVQRSTKASFTEVFYGPSSRAFAERWDGTGLDLSLIDPDGLRREWSKPRPDFRSMTPLQAAWLASADQQPPDGSVSLAATVQSKFILE